MKQKYLSSLAWIVKIQWQTSRLSFIWTIFNSVFDGLRAIISTFAVAKLITSVSAVALQKADPKEVYFWLAILLIIELFYQGVAITDRIVRVRFQQKMEVATNERFFFKMYELSQEQFDDQAFNTKLDRAREALMQMYRVLDELSWAVSAIIGFAGAIVAILVASTWVGLIILITTIPSAILLVKQNKMREKIARETEPYERVAFRSRWMLIDPNFMPEIRLMNAFKRLIAVWKKNLIKAQSMDYENNKKRAKFDAVADSVQPVVSFGANIYFFRLLLAGTLGLDSFIFLRGMLEQASSGAVSVANAVQRVHELSINLQNFSDVYNTPPAIPDGIIKVVRPLTIEFKDVSFSYPGTDQSVLDKVSFTIAPGSKLALVGENGAGKTTLIKLLLRQYLPSEGTITVNDKDIRELELESYYSAISNLSQEFLTISHLTIRDNLTMGLGHEATEQEIYKNTDLVGATDFINKLPKRLETRLDTSFDDGRRLSGGQNQRLGVARALMRAGDIMILDEPTSAIDAKAEYEIFNNIYKAHAGKTTLIVSHRFSTVRKADKIIVMENGKITEYGSHEELIKHGGLYKEMFETQAEGYK